MTAPANTKIVSFEQRLTLVQTEIARRAAKVSQQQQAAIKARLWCQWLKREVSA